MISLKQGTRRGDYIEVKGILNTPGKVGELKKSLEEKTGQERKDYQNDMNCYFR